MLLLFEKGIRGGISMISNRYGKANNKHMGKKFDPRSPSKFIVYLDENALYGWAMTTPLPVGDFKWMEEKELENWKNFPCILEVDLEYPKKLHDLHNDYPLAPERLKINNVEKLIPNLWDKEKYVVHHEHLKLYEELGLKVKKIHRGIRFREEPCGRRAAKEVDRKPDIYEFDRVVFGDASAPFRAQYVSQENARIHREEFPLAAATVTKSTYMDDSLDSVRDEQTAVQLVQELQDLWAKAGMKARKWLSNSPEVLAVIPKELRAFEIDLKDSLPTTKTLGVLWRAQQDVLTFQTKKPSEEEELTKRIILSKVAGVFDPLGLASPFAVRANYCEYCREEENSRSELVKHENSY